MARQTQRRKPTLECLEQREVLSAGPSNTAQYILETVNDFRSNPDYAAAWMQSHVDSLIQSNIQHYGVDITSVSNSISSAAAQQPLAWNAQINNAAQGQSQDMATNGYQSHTNSQGQNLDARLTQAGYTTNRVRSTEDAFAYARSADNALQSFLIDWGVAGSGHRNGLLDIGQNSTNSAGEAGIGFATTSAGSAVGPDVVTIDLARRQNAQPQIVGTVFDDPQNTGYFTMNSGIANATITVTNTQTGATQTTQTWDSGGYQLALTPGSYTATATVGNQNLGTKSFTISDQNVHLSFPLQDAQPTPTPAPSTPAPAPSPVVVNTPAVATPTTSSPALTTSNSVANAVSAASDDWSVAGSSINWYSSWSGSH